MVLKDILDRSILSNVQFLCNMLLIMVATAAVGSFGTSIFGYLVSMVEAYFASLNKYSKQQEKIRWMRDMCVREGQECNADLFAMDDSAVPHLRALKDMFYGTDSLCGSLSCKDSLIQSWNSIHLTTFVTAIVLVIVGIACVPYLKFVLGQHTGVLPVQQRRTLTIEQQAD